MPRVNARGSFEEVLFEGLTPEERQRAIEDYRKSDKEFDAIRTEIAKAGNISGEAMKRTVTRNPIK